MIRVESLMSSQESNLTLVTQPEVIQKGQMLEVSVAITSPRGLSVTVPRVYLEMLDSKGRVVWPLSVIAKDTSGFTRLISTAELQTNTRYTIRASLNNKLIRHSSAFFKTAKSIIPGLLLPLTLLSPELLPKTLIPENPEKEIWYVYTTELDQRVCPICLNFSGRTFGPNDELIPIGPPEHGGKTHWRCRCVYAPQNVLNAALLKAKTMRASALAVIAVTKHKEKRKQR